MKKEPKYKPCVIEECENEFLQFNSLKVTCSVECAIKYAEQKREDKEAKTEKETKDWNKEKKTRDLDLLSVDGYRKKYIQPLINHIARIIDKDQDCIANPGRTEGQFHAGHRHSVGGNRTLALNLHNIHAQSAESNNHQGGDHLKYRIGLKLVYGSEYADYIDETLMQCPSLHLSKDDLINAKPILEAIKKKYLKLGLIYTPKQRMRLRDQLNAEIGLYTDEFASFAYFQQSKKMKKEDKDQLNLGL